jgi:hypothetical protein
MRFIVASFLVLSNFCALNAEPLTPMPTQKYRLACKGVPRPLRRSSVSMFQSMRRSILCAAVWADPQHLPTKLHQEFRLLTNWRFPTLSDRCIRVEPRPDQSI